MYAKLINWLEDDRNAWLFTAGQRDTETWCNDCGAPVSEGESECKAYDMLRIRRECLREFLQALGLNLKAKGPNILVVDKDGHEVNL